MSILAVTPLVCPGGAYRKVAAVRDREDVAALSTPVLDERRHLPVLLAALGLANLSAYLRDAVIAGEYGAGMRTDAYFIAAFFPALLTTVLVLESAVPALVPALSRVASDSGATRHLLRGVLAAALVALGCAVIVTWGAAVPLVHVLAHGWHRPEVLLAASLLRIVAWSLLPLGLAAVLAALLNVHYRFVVPPLGVGIMNAAVICTTVLLGGRLGIYAPAWGMVAGSVLSLLLQIWSVARLDLRFDPATVAAPLSHVRRAMLPTLIFSVLTQNVVIVERWLASTLPAGRISYLVYAGKLMMSPLLVITAAGGLLAFVAMSHANATGDHAAFRTSFVRSARMLTLLLAMATLALVSLRRPVVELALQHGRFTGHDAAMTATLLAIYALGLVPNGLAWLLYRGLQSRGKYWRAVSVALMAAVIYLAGALALFHVWGLRGIAAAFPVSQVASCALLLFRQPDYLQAKMAHVLRFAGSVALLCAGVGLVMGIFEIGVHALRVDATTTALLDLTGGAGAIVAGLLLGLELLRMPEASLFRAWLRTIIAGAASLAGRGMGSDSRRDL